MLYYSCKDYPEVIKQANLVVENFQMYVLWGIGVMIKPINV